MEYPFWITPVYLATTVVCLLLAAVLFRANPRRGLNQVAALLVTLCGVWQFATALLYVTPGSAAVYIRILVAMHGVGVGGVITLLAALQFPAEQLDRLLRRTRWVWVAAAVYAAPLFTPWFIPYESTAEEPLRGVLWYPLGALQIVGGLFVVGMTVRAALTLRGAARSTAQMICGVCGLLILLMGLRFVLRPWLPDDGMPLSNAVIGLVVVAAFAFTVLTRRIFRARVLLMSALFHSLSLTLAIAAAAVVLQWSGGTISAADWGHYAAVVAALAVWTGVFQWRRRRLDQQAMRLGGHLLAQFDAIRRRGRHDDGGLSEALDEVLDWTGARQGRVLLRDGHRWVSGEVVLRADDPLAVHLERHRWVTTESLARTWRVEQAVLAGLSLERLGGVVAVVASRGLAGRGAMLVLGEKASGDFYSHQEVATLHVLADALAGMVESREAGQRGRALGRIEALEMLGASIGHDFKQHLVAVRLLAHRIGDRDLPAAEVTGYLDKLEGELGKLGEFSRRLTRLGRSGPGHRQTLAVGEVIADVVAFLQESAERHGVTVVHDRSRPDDALTAWVDRQRLYQALVNLGVNAVEAMRIGEPEAPGRELRFAARREGGGLVIEVADNGPGLPAEVLAHLFDPFVTRGKPDGDGLGLYLTWDAITREGGLIRYEANQPRGTRFIITLPD